MSERDIRALKLVLFIVLTVATIALVSWSVQSDVREGERWSQQFEQMHGE